MDPRAIEQSQRRLDRIRIAIETMRGNPEFHVYQSAWEDFLMAAGGVYSKLEQGAKASPRSKGWFGGLKHKRKSDPVLRYIHHARNAEEHGLSESTERRVGKILRIKESEFVEPIDDSGLWREERVLRGRIKKVPDEKSENGMVTLSMKTEYVNADYVELTTVRDERFGDVFGAPYAKLENGKLRKLTPLQVAKRTLSYLETVVSEAAQFTT